MGPVAVRGWLRHNLRQNPSVYRLAKRGLMLCRYVTRRTHEPEFRWFGTLRGPGLFLDIGANIGQSACSLRAVNRYLRILSLEANPALEPDLKFVRRFVSRFDYRIVALGDKPGTMTLTIPIAGQVPATQDASLDPAFLERRRGNIVGAVGDFAIQQVAVKVVTVDSLNLAPRVIKMDVEGFEEQVLRGAESTIEKYRPVVMMEMFAGTGRALDWLTDHGYRLWSFKNGSLRAYEPEAMINVLAFHPEGLDRP